MSGPKPGMIMVYASRVVAVDPGRWLPEADDALLEITSPDGRARIVITAIEYSRTPTVRELGKMLTEYESEESGARRTSAIRETALGAYYGVTVDSLMEGSAAEDESPDDDSADGDASPEEGVSGDEGATVAEREFVRDYFVCLGELMLDIRLSCPSDAESEYVPKAERILATLGDRRP